MSHIEKRQEIDEWEVEVCDNCGHEKAQHYDQPTKIDNRDGSSYVWSGCITLKLNGRILPGDPAPNPYPRCHCVEFK